MTNKETEGLEVEIEDTAVAEEGAAEKRETTGKRVREKSLENEEDNIFWIKIEGEKRLATINLVPGNQVYREKLVKIGDEEFRAWDPYRSKLGAAIMNGLEFLPIVRKSKVLYLGVSTGTTASHVSDIVGPNGIVFAVEHSSRVARDFLERVASFRSNIVPILQDARSPKEYFKKGGYIMLVVKTRSIDVTREPSQVIRSEAKKLSANFEIVQEINLEPYEGDHGMIVAKFLG